ncbi:MAG: hypothetical protein J6A59_01795 [Lachnospiraceae bacterium]|nr:hypothetical protein [Lachnospiraceae bacterium]
MENREIAGIERIIAISMIECTEGYKKFAQVSRFNPLEIKDSKVWISALGLKFECKSITFIVSTVADNGLAFFVGEETDIMDELKANKLSERIEQYDDKVIYHHKARVGSELHILGRIASICEWADKVYLGKEDEQWQLKGLSEFEQLEKIVEYIRMNA